MKSLLIKINCEYDYSSAALFSSENRTDKKPCVFCGLLNHKSIKCLKVSNPVARKRKVCKNVRKLHVRKVDYILFVLIKIIMHPSIVICIFNRNQLSRFDNQSSNNLANNQTNILLPTALVTITDLHKSKLK